MPVCKLCHRDVEALCASHIIPEGLYRGVYDGKHRFPIFSSDRVGPIAGLQQKGIREPLLCLGCEGHFSKWETYALGQLARWATDEPVDHGQMWVYKVNYAPFKLFQMSILWRMGMASNEMFDSVDLGPRHLERLRQMLWKSDPGGPHEYMCRFASIAETNAGMKRIIVPPVKAKKIQGHWCCYFLAGGLLWQYIVSSHTQEIHPSQVTLTADGSLFIAKEGVVPRHVYMSRIEQVTKKSEAYFAKRRGAKNEST